MRSVHLFPRGVGERYGSFGYDLRLIRLIDVVSVIDRPGLLRCSDDRFG